MRRLPPVGLWAQQGRAVALQAIWACGVLLAASAAVAQPMVPAAALGPTPVGLWRTIDDEARTEKSLVRIFEQGGAVHGRIEKLLDPAAKPQAVCELCTDERKGQAVLGLTVLRNLKVDTDDKGLWTGGDVLDPNNGKVYRARLKPVDGGRKLELRGYIGPFYRTQVWQRVE